MAIGLRPRMRIAVLPDPMPQNTRPGASRFIVAWAAAVTGANRRPATATPVPMSMRAVSLAISAIVAKQSDHSIGLSATHTRAYPSSSARTA